MCTSIFRITLFSAAFSAFIFCAVSNTFAAEKKEQPTLLFVQNASSGSFDGKTLTLEGVSSTNYFSDRPDRIVGHMLTGSFVEQWDKGKDSFAADPPNAAISILDGSGTNNAVVELLEPKLKDNQLQYQVKVLEGKLPSSFKTASLFIDDSKTNNFLAGMATTAVLGRVRRNTQYRRAQQAQQAQAYAGPSNYHQSAPASPCR